MLLRPSFLPPPLQGITERAGAGVNVTYFPSPVGAAPLTQFYAAARGDHFLDFACEACPDGMYAALRVEGYASPTPCAGSLRGPFLRPMTLGCAGAAPSPAPSPAAGCTELALFWNPTNLSNLVAAADFPPPPGYGYVRPLAYALPLSAAAGERQGGLPLSLPPSRHGAPTASPRASSSQRQPDDAGAVARLRYADRPAARLARRLLHARDRRLARR